MLRSRIAELPEDEFAAVDHIDDHLRHLDRYVEDFGIALNLFKFIKANADGLPRNSLFVPARDGAMTIYHFVTTLDIIAAGFKDCPTLRAMVDHSKRKQAISDCRAAFPVCEKIRHAIAHDGELWKNREKKAENELKGPKRFAGLIIGNSASTARISVVAKDELALTIGGEIVSYRLNEESLDILANARRNTVLSFGELTEKYL